jgi:hypothetical protein
MKKYILMLCAIVFLMHCNGGTEYPLTVEFRVGGTPGIEFTCYYGDTLGNGTNTDGVVPESYFVELNNDTVMAVGSFYKTDTLYWDDTMIVELYVDDEFVKSDTSIDSDDIRLYYPEYPE